MPKAVEAPTGLSMKLMPIPMIPTGITRVHQKSREFVLKVELSDLVVVFMLLPHAAKVCVAKTAWILQAEAQEAVEAHVRQSDKPYRKRD
jgi:hypothetical protein